MHHEFGYAYTSKDKQKGVAASSVCSMVLCAGCICMEHYCLCTTDEEIPNTRRVNMNSHHVDLTFPICNLPLFDESICMHVKNITAHM